MRMLMLTASTLARDDRDGAPRTLFCRRTSMGRLPSYGPPPPPQAYGPPPPPAYGPPPPQAYGPPAYGPPPVVAYGPPPPPQTYYAPAASLCCPGVPTRQRVRATGLRRRPAFTIASVRGIGAAAAANCGHGDRTARGFIPASARMTDPGRAERGRRHRVCGDPRDLRPPGLGRIECDIGRA